MRKSIDKKIKQEINLKSSYIFKTEKCLINQIKQKAII